MFRRPAATGQSCLVALAVIVAVTLGLAAGVVYLA